MIKKAFFMAVLLFTFLLAGSLSAAQIDSFVLEPNPKTAEHGNTVNAIVRVQNASSVQENIEVRISVKDSLGNSLATDAVPVTQMIAAGRTEEFTIGFTVADWENGNYPVTAAVYQLGSSDPDDKQTIILTVLEPIRGVLPELSPVLLPLIAFSVLAAIFLFERKKN